MLPFLLGDRFAARVDLKADRKTGVLQIPAAWLEPAADQEETAARWPPSCTGWPAGWACTRWPRPSAATSPARSAAALKAHAAAGVPWRP